MSASARTMQRPARLKGLPPPGPRGALCKPIPSAAPAPGGHHRRQRHRRQQQVLTPPRIRWRRNLASTTWVSWRSRTGKGSRPALPMDICRGGLPNGFLPAARVLPQRMERSTCSRDGHVPPGPWEVLRKSGRKPVGRARVRGLPRRELCRGHARCDNLPDFRTTSPPTSRAQTVPASPAAKGRGGVASLTSAHERRFRGSARSRRRVGDGPR